MRTVYLITHPESTHHVQGIVGGWHDSSLTEAGRRDAEAIAGALQQLIPAVARAELWSSDLQRCTEVAGRIASVLNVPMQTDAGLREKSYGIAEGKPQSWLDERFLPPPHVGDRMHHHEGIEGAETKQEFAERSYAALERVLASGAEQVVIVTHGFALTFLVMAWLQVPIDALGYANLRSTPGGITTLREDDFFANRQVARLDDVQHLTGERR